MEMEKLDDQLRLSAGGLRRTFGRLSLVKGWNVLLILYILFSILRILLAFLHTLTPEAQPDAGLYLHLSHSIIREGALLFRGQPIRFEYILYPLLLSPLHLLPEGVNIFRAVQVFNVLVMNLSVFPAYALARGITGSRNKGLFIAFLTLLMPDFFMVQQVMTESVSFPLILAAYYAYYRFFDAPPRFRVALLWGALGFLLYALKPGYAALPACFYLVLLWRFLRDKQWDRLVHALTSLLMMLFFFGLYRLLLIYGLHMSPEQSTLYQSQTHPLTWNHLAQVFNGFFMYAAYVPLAFAFFPLFFPAAHLRAFDKKERDLLLVFLLAILATVLGTVYIIYYDELMDGFKQYEARIHVRYISVFLPVLTAFLFSPRLEGRRLNTPLFIGLSFSLVSILLLGPVPSMSGWSYHADALLLAAATFEAEGFSGRLLWPVFALVFMLAAAFTIQRRGWEGQGRRLVCAFLLFSFIANSAVAAYYYRYHADSPYPKAAPQAIALAGGKTALGVVTDAGIFWPEAIELDLASRFSVPVVELDDIIGNTGADGGVSAFLPKTYWYEKPANQIPAPENLVIVSGILDRIRLADGVIAVGQTTPVSAYTVIDVPSGSPWIHSGLSGFDENWVKEGSRFTLFDPAIRENGKVTLRLQARAGEGEVTLILSYAGQTLEFPLSTSLSWLRAEFTVENPEEAVTVTFASRGGNGNVYVETYLVE
jgi:hypothetical protein